MAAVTTVFLPEGNRVLVLSRFEGDDGFVGSSRSYIDPGGNCLGIPYEQLRAAGTGEIIVSEDGQSAVIRAAGR